MNRDWKGSGSQPWRKNEILEVSGAFQPIRRVHKLDMKDLYILQEVTKDTIRNKKKV